MKWTDRVIICFVLIASWTWTFCFNYKPFMNIWCCPQVWHAKFVCNMCRAHVVHGDTRPDFDMFMFHSLFPCYSYAQLSFRKSCPNYYRFFFFFWFFSGISWIHAQSWAHARKGVSYLTVFFLSIWYVKFFFFLIYSFWILSFFFLFLFLCVVCTVVMFVLLHVFFRIYSNKILSFVGCVFWLGIYIPTSSIKLLWAISTVQSHVLFFVFLEFWWCVVYG